MLLNSVRWPVPQWPSLLTSLEEEHGAEHGICCEPVMIDAVLQSLVHLEWKLNILGPVVESMIKKVGISQLAAKILTNSQQLVNPIHTLD